MGRSDEPMAIKTKLGWVIFGMDTKLREASEHFLMIHYEENAMNSMMRSYFSTEDFGVKPVATIKSSEMERAEKIIANTLVKSQGRYEIGLLWKTDEVKFPDSYQAALRRLESQEKQLKRNPEMQTWLCETFKEYEKKGYVRKLSREEAALHGPRTFYLPHFVVVNKNKPVLKPRLVFDAAARVKDVSLNSQLLTGPDEVPSLFGILLRFREGNICVSGDIKEMFHQVKIRKEDQNAQRILWREGNAARRPDTYVMQVMTFGATCSPSCAQAVKNRNAEEHQLTHPLALRPITRQHYVDDYLDSFFSLEEAIETVEQVRKVHAMGGFLIRNFVSNNSKLRQTIPEEHQLHQSLVDIKEKNQCVEKILGVQWNTQLDTFGYRVNIARARTDVGGELPTKREVLSFVMCIYDPLGLISHLTIQGRIIMQAVHIAVEDWDAKIPDNLAAKWHEWTTTISEAKDLAIPRPITAAGNAPIDIHTFVDASLDAFAACVYARSCFKGCYVVRLVAAKARVAPIHALTIPKLELQAAILGARLTETVAKELRLPIHRTTFWTDSRTVLSWINSEHRKFKQFVAHRVSEILDTSSASQWRWVPSKENPADAATKVTNASMWFNGPAFLLSKECDWPEQQPVSDTEEEKRVAANLVLHHHETVVPELNYSTWDRLLRHHTFLKKFVDFLKDRKAFNKMIGREDVEHAKYALLRKAQWEGFPDEMEALTRGQEISSKSSIKTLLPYLDQYNLLRSRSRLENATALPKSARSPILLPQKPRIVKLLVRNYHEKYHHQADNVVIGTLRQTYWIVQLRNVLKAVKGCCQRCILNTATPQTPLMAPLPSFRTHPHNPPFLHSGVDYFGPLDVTVKRSIEKRWGAIFTCMSTRAVHIELAEKLDVDSFLICLKNFTNRRGKITHLYSDNGTNFIGADRLMKKLVEEIGERMGREAALRHQIEWKFNPPSAPHFGGSWERLIQIVKKALHHMATEWKTRHPYPETLRAALIEIEAMINSRPLTHIPLSNEEDEVLTPFHFLIGRGVESLPPDSLDTSYVSRQQFKVAQHNAKVFWDRWKKEYLPTLIKRNKWTNKAEPVKVGDVVVLTNDNAPAGQWLKGKVLEVHPAADGQVRVVSVKTATGILKRPAVKVAVVDVKPKEHLLVVKQPPSKTTKRVLEDDVTLREAPSTKRIITAGDWITRLLADNSDRE
ncbi:uncharacterized protein LOC121599013 [Anopheles merus]|uniref:uncharacterized protein LOC121599013 n=1 Tax=Anopheles merus TaxID=30066 RepID=UPI001BE478DB|nr:uncharacterized protein LOC121599013 [Anopheles merus]